MDKMPNIGGSGTHVSSRPRPSATDGRSGPSLSDVDNGFRSGLVALAGLILGYMTGDYSATIAELIVRLLFPYQDFRTTEIAVQLLLFLTGCWAAFGALAAKRGWLSTEHATIGVLAALVSTISAIFVLVVQSIATGEPLLQIAYSIGWAVVLWFVPLAFLPNPLGLFSAFVRRALGVLTVAIPMTVVGVVVGFLVEQVVIRATSVSMSPLYFIVHGAPERFWIVRPQVGSPIVTSFVAVAFANVWWRGLGWTKRSSRKWGLSITALVTAYAGLGGLLLFGSPVTGNVGHVLGFAAFPAAAAVAVLAAYSLTRVEEVGKTVGWPVSGLFWVILPFSFAATHAVLVAAMALLAHDRAEGNQLVMFVLAHAFNGGVIGVSVRTTCGLFRVIPDIRPE